jgi:hypothetical protein
MVGSSDNWSKQDELIGEDLSKPPKYIKSKDDRGKSFESFSKDTARGWFP